MHRWLVLWPRLVRLTRTPTTRRPAAIDGKVEPFETLGAAMMALHTPDCRGTHNRNMTLRETLLSHR
jgi:hypothetical protein